MTSKPKTTPNPSTLSNVSSNVTTPEGIESGFIVPLREGKNHREDWLILPVDFPQVVQVTGRKYVDWGDTLHGFYIRNPFNIVRPTLNYIKRMAAQLDVQAAMLDVPAEVADLKITLVRKGWSYADTTDTSYPVYGWLRASDKPGLHSSLNNAPDRQGGSDAKSR